MSRWLEETGGARGASYDQAFQELAASGVDVHGEAARVAALAASGARVLDAGCGTGRVAVELARRGYAVTGVDNDASMLEVARGHHGVRWQDADLACLDLQERTTSSSPPGTSSSSSPRAPSSAWSSAWRPTWCRAACS